MEINQYIEQKKNFYNDLLEIIESDEEIYSDDIFNDLFEDLDNQTDKEEIKRALELISKITENHYRSSNFISKIETIFLHFSETIKQTFTNQEIFDIFKVNKRILLLLIQTGIITFDNSIIQYILSISKKENEDKIESFFEKNSRII